MLYRQDGRKVFNAFYIKLTVNADLHDSELFEFRLAREGRTAVRSIDWSPQGVASHGG